MAADNKPAEASSEKKAKKVKKTKKTKKRRHSSILTPLAGLLLGAAIICTLTWYGALYFGEFLAKYQATQHSQSWTDKVLREFRDPEKSFTTGKLAIVEKYALSDFQKGTTIYRYNLIDAQGNIFWSSVRDRTGIWSSVRDNLGLVSSSKVFAEKIKNGETYSVFSRISASKVDGYLARQPADKMDFNAMRSVTKTVIPVLDSKGKAIGAFMLFSDVTDQLSWFNQRAKQVAMFLIAIVALVFMGVAILIASYARQRSKYINALKTSEHEARIMAEQLQVMNDDIVNLNLELEENVRILRTTQDQLILNVKMAQLGQLAATVAHDIRNPLGSIRTSTFLMRRKYINEHPEMEKQIGRIEKGIERCETIISDLLGFTRTPELKKEMINLDQWIVDFVHEQAMEMSRKISFECALGLEDKEVLADTGQLSRAITNFLSNASEAMIGKGEHKPENPTENPTITITTALTDRGVEISVTDNGPGFSPENLKKALDPLFTTKKYGTGLGLPAIEKIFEQHGGGLEIKSIPGYGATITGWFPVKTRSEKSQPARKTA